MERERPRLRARAAGFLLGKESRDIGWEGRVLWCTNLLMGREHLMTCKISETVVRSKTVLDCGFPMRGFARQLAVREGWARHKEKAESSVTVKFFCCEITCSHVRSHRIGTVKRKRGT